MKEVTFLFGIHNHQPVGNFDEVIEAAYDRAYRPFLDGLERHPGVRVAIHNSGVLIDWFEERHPDYLDRLVLLAARGQVELLTGGYYEPILPAISDADKIGQIRKLTKKLKDRLGYEASGLWLAERVWEPSLPGPLARAGVGYLMVDDAHFLAAGSEPDSLWNYWLTEDQGDSLAVWPISKALRYLVPFEPAAKTIEFLKGVASQGGGRVALLADDGEKFGVWPDTFEQVHENGWLEEFFSLIEANSGWLRMGLPGEEIAARPPAGRIYLPTASYSEMMEWALPTPVQRSFHVVAEKMTAAASPELRFLRGGFWRNFLARYPESNLMHKRMLDVRRRIDASELPETERMAACDDIWRAQCNCAYWHGVFGGLYLPHLRDAIYRHILAAERRLAVSENPGHETRLTVFDLDVDGFEEWRLSNGVVAALVSPTRGGALTEFDDLATLRSFSHGLTRRPEAYHDRLIALTLPAEEREGSPPAGSGSGGGKGQAASSAAGAPVKPGAAAPHEAGAGSVRSIHDRVEMKEPGLEKRLFFDWYRRESLLDHFFRSDTTLEAFDRAEYGEQGDFIEHAYTAGKEKGPGGQGIRLRRAGSVWIGGRAVPVSLEKTLRLEDKARRLEIAYSLTQEDDRLREVWFGIEFNFTMLAGREPDRYYTIDGKKPTTEPQLAGTGAHDGIRSVALHDDWQGLTVALDSSRPAGLWRLPVETITQSEAGFERIYQSSCLVPHWKLELQPGRPWTVRLTLSVLDAR